tara:strand:- start:212 stop:340 length:129 start_codon:yes stop_codon:yes gene_type:complete
MSVADETPVSDIPRPLPRTVVGMLLQLAPWALLLLGLCAVLA